MNKRKSLSKKMRFDVLKRDSFTCQYCGRSAPDVLLEVDHIKPVVDGGSNSILNLITSCRDCNRGKGKESLDENNALVKQKKQADELQARREQLELMCKWKEDLLSEKETEIESLERLGQSYYPNLKLLDHGKKELRNLIKSFGFEEVYEAFDIALGYYEDIDEAFNKIGGICFNRRKQNEL